MLSSTALHVHWAQHWRWTVPDAWRSNASAPAGGRAQARAVYDVRITCALPGCAPMPVPVLPVHPPCPHSPSHQPTRLLAAEADVARPATGTRSSHAAAAAASITRRRLAQLVPPTGPASLRIPAATWPRALGGVKRRCAGVLPLPLLPLGFAAAGLPRLQGLVEAQGGRVGLHTAGSKVQHLQAFQRPHAAGGRGGGVAGGAGSVEV